jgi:hypothetical protein
MATATPTSTSSTTEQNKSTPSSTKSAGTPKNKTPTKEPVQQKSAGKRKTTDSPLLKHLKKEQSFVWKKSASTGKTNTKSPNTAVQTDTPNVSQNHEQLPLHNLTPLLLPPTEEVDHHKSLFYEQLQLYYSTNNQRKLMG